MEKLITGHADRPHGHSQYRGYPGIRDGAKGREKEEMVWNLEPTDWKGDKWTKERTEIKV